MKKYPITIIMCLNTILIGLFIDKALCGITILLILIAILIEWKDEK